METIVELITNVGFPIAMTIYLLVTQNKTIKENTKAIQELTIYLKNR